MTASTVLPHGYYPDFIYAEWHPTLNGDNTPYNITRGSHTEIMWACPHGIHHYPMRLSDRLRGRNCPYCVGKKVWRGDNDFETRQAVAAGEWHPYLNGCTFPWQYTEQSTEGKFWVCPNGHVYFTRISHRTNGTGCKYCKGMVVIPGETDMFTTNPEMAAEFHPTLNGDRSPHNLMAGSGFIARWNCPSGHVYPMSCWDRLRGRNCPECVKAVSKLESELTGFVAGLGFEMRTSDRTLLKPQEVDIYLPGQGLAIEFNGLHWHSEKANTPQDYHYKKWVAAKAQGVRLLQVWEDDWLWRRERVQQYVADILQGDAPLPGEGVVERLGEVEAVEFLLAHSLRQHVHGDVYVGVRAGDALVGVLSALVAGDTAEVVAVALTCAPGEVLRQLVAGLQTTTAVREVNVVADHFYDTDEMFERAGFELVELLPPAYGYYHQKQRMTAVQYEALNYQGAPASRVWDAGHARWVYRV